MGKRVLGRAGALLFKPKRGGEIVGAGGRGLRFLNREKGRRRFGGEGADRWAPHVSCWTERGGGRGCWWAGWAKQAEKRGGEERRVDFFFLISNSFSKVFAI